MNKIIDFQPFSKMFTPQEKAQCVFWFTETKSDIQTQRNYTTYNTEITPLDFFLWVIKVL